MSNQKAVEVMILGAGLSGLTAAAILKREGFSVRLIESRSRIGGRILTAGLDSNQPIELGATWLGKKHKNLRALLDSLGLEIFKQEIGRQAFFEPMSNSDPYLVEVPDNSEPSYRIKGGSSKLIEKLVDRVGVENILTSESALSIKAIADGLEVQTSKAVYTAQRVITTLPPNLLVNRIDFEPALPKALMRVATSTHTWMDDSIKVALTYAEPFWLASDKSGTIMSNVGPVHEMYDHSNYEKSFFALMGFFNSNYHSLTKDQRLERILDQFQKYYGPQAKDYLSYEEKVWRKDADTYETYVSHIVPHQNNGDSIYQNQYMDNRLIISGTETSPVFPGYMDGAVFSGMLAARWVRSSLHSSGAD